MNHSLTAFKPNLPKYGKFKVKADIPLKKYRKHVGIIAALPLCTSWMFFVIPFMKGLLWVRF